MKVYLTPPQSSRGLQRIADALWRYLPDGWFPTPYEDKADVVVIYAIGRRDAVERRCEKILKTGKRYAIIQVCLRSTMTPYTSAWREIWHGASVVWSYYDLNQAIADDDGACGLDNFYHAPLGADASVFYPRDRDGHYSYVIASSGPSRLQESVRECWLAAEQVDRNYLHIGMKHGPFGGRPDYISGVSDDVLAEHYSDCEFVSGLRRTEGFELPAVEGLLCGARPILFSTPDYRHWYEPWGEFIEETYRQGVVDQLVELFKRGARPVTAEEREAAVQRFNWETIVRGFYEGCYDS